MIKASYEYRVDASGRIVSLAPDNSWNGVGKVNLDGVQRPISGIGPLRSEERDVLRVAAAILDADRLSPRCPKEHKRQLRDISWQRMIRVRVAVENPDRWSNAVSVLQKLLMFMTDDSWEISFEGAHAYPSQQMLFPRSQETPGEVALFSGGLDSVAGAQVRGLRTAGKLIAVSACGNEVRERAQLSAVARLREHDVDVDWIGITHQLRDTNRSRRELETSQRSRSLLFLAMGAAVASRLEMPEFSVYETGIGGLNLPFSPAQVASQGTRAMHPLTLATVIKLPN